MRLQHETLRIFAPLTHIARGTTNPTPITYKGKEHIIPANTIVYLNSYAIHQNPAVWSTESTASPPADFDPTRFIAKVGHDDEKAEEVSLTLQQRKSIPVGNAVVKTPANKGAFIPWSGGPRVCPGQKMSQVEFVTVFMTIFRQWRVEVVGEDGDEKDAEKAREKVKGALKDSMPRLTMQMNNPQGVALRFVKR
jgi:cytochrome P450